MKIQTIIINMKLQHYLAYILSEKRLKIGENIYTQGDKSKDVIFITRGEVIVTQSVTDLEGRNYSAFVERVGPYRILGLDAYVNFHSFILFIYINH